MQNTFKKMERYTDFSNFEPPEINVEVEATSEGIFLGLQNVFMNYPWIEIVIILFIIFLGYKAARLLPERPKNTDTMIVVGMSCMVFSFIMIYIELFSTFFTFSISFLLWIGGILWKKWGTAL